MKLEMELHAELPHEFSLYKNYLLFGDWGSFYFFSHLCIKMFAMIPKIEIITVITSMLFEINSISNTSCAFWQMGFALAVYSHLEVSSG
mgnify:CR=1 FL=1